MKVLYENLVVSAVTCSNGYWLSVSFGKFVRENGKVAVFSEAQIKTMRSAYTAIHGESEKAELVKKLVNKWMERIDSQMSFLRKSVYALNPPTSKAGKVLLDIAVTGGYQRPSLDMVEARRGEMAALETMYEAREFAKLWHTIGLPPFGKGPAGLLASIDTTVDGWEDSARAMIGATAIDNGLFGDNNLEFYARIQVEQDYK